jgi:hypothetical protein
MNPLATLRTALNAANPAFALRDAVQVLDAAGTRKKEIQSSLEILLQESRQGENAGAIHEDAILDVLDSLEGWCHANARLLPDS